MFRRISIYMLLALGLVLNSGVSFAELSPEIQLGSRGVISFNGIFSSEDNTSEASDFSDTSLMIGFRQKLYCDWRGQMVIGFQFPDADSNLGQVLYHQTFIQLEDKSHILKFGRSRVRNTLIEFPTLRDDDAIYFTDVLNPFSLGKNSEGSQYGNVLEASHVFGKRFWLNIHGEHFVEVPALLNDSEPDFGFNAVGAMLEYRVPETQRWNREVLDQIGIGFNGFLTARDEDESKFDEILKNIMFSAVLNVHPDPVHFLDFRHQTIYNVGFGEVERLDNYTDMTRASSLATFTSLRYLYRRLEHPTAQLSLGFGYKTFPDLSETADQIQLIANMFYRMGENFDVGLQFQYRHNSDDLKKLLGEKEGIIQLSLIYSVDQSWNDQFDDRDSVLSLEHGYIP